jgi:hypothetical protein
VHSLFGANGPESNTTNPWVRRWLPEDELPRRTARPPASDWVTLAINLEALVTGESEPVSRVDPKSRLRPLVNLETEEGMLKRRQEFGVFVEAYHKEVRVSWQPQPLPITILSRQDDVRMLGELAVDLNAWIRVGTDDFEFQKVHVISTKPRPGQPPPSLQGAMTALPEGSDDPVIVLRVPRSLDIILRYWVVDGDKGLPHRVDAWRIRLDADGAPKTRFFCMEPESYL